MAKPIHKKFDEQHITKIKNDLNKWLGPAWGAGFDSSKNKAKWFLDNEEALITNDNFVKNYDIDALINVDSKKMKSMHAKQPDFNKLSENQIKRFTASTNISEDELKKYYDFENDRIAKMKEFNDARYAELDKQRREGERAKDDSYYNYPIANEYARKAYIQGDKELARTQELLGKAASISDFASFPVSLIGPALRVSQKYLADEDIDPKETAMDIGGAVVPDFIERPAKLAMTLLKGKGGRIASKAKAVKKADDIVNARIAKEDFEAGQRAAAEQKALMDVDISKVPDTDLAAHYDLTTDPNVKQKLADVRQARIEFREAQNLDKTTNLPKYEINDIVDQAYERKLRAEEAYKNTVDKLRPEMEIKAGQPKLDVDMDKLEIVKQTPYVRNAEGELVFNPYYKDVPLSEMNSYGRNMAYKPSMLDNAVYTGLTLGGRKFLRSTMGGRFGEWNSINYDPKYDEDKALKEIESMYSGEWKNGKPANYNEPMIKAAYDRWLEEQRRKGNYDVIWRLGE